MRKRASAKIKKGQTVKEVSGNAPTNSMNTEMDKFCKRFLPDQQIGLVHQITICLWKYTLKYYQEPDVDLYDIVNYLEMLTENANDRRSGIVTTWTEDFYDCYPVEMQYRYLYFLLTTVSKWQMRRGIDYVSDELLDFLDQLFYLSILKSGVLSAKG